MEQHIQDGTKSTVLDHTAQWRKGTVGLQRWPKDTQVRPNLVWLRAGDDNSVAWDALIVGAVSNHNEAV